MRIYILLFFITGIIFQSQSQTLSDSIAEDPVVEYYPPILPQFPGGDTAFVSFIKKNLVYPKDAIKKGIAGKVYVQFDVETDGSLTNIKVVRSLYPSCDQAAIDVISKSPKWKPATDVRTGLPQKIRMAQPIKFVLP